MPLEERVHPIPFRTRQLSSPSSMILHILVWESRTAPRLYFRPQLYAGAFFLWWRETGSFALRPRQRRLCAGSSTIRVHSPLQRRLFLAGEQNSSVSPFSYFCGFDRCESFPSLLPKVSSMISGPLPEGARGDARVLCFSVGNFRDAEKNRPVHYVAQARADRLVPFLFWDDGSHEH